eukprot:TRINITY_DN709_c0_g1_i1.p1 TRINITY_DN709_c0_g1~~TRINITY_DN709_c0_g1_i1.p1  ORF type:complete len:153 (-),score=26.00 TRINITY_DN709_c0_g1_i1:64-498(-)
MASLGTQARLARGAAQASNAASSAVAGATGGGDSDDEDTEKADSGAEEAATGAGVEKPKIKGSKNRIDTSEWVDDLLEGFAEIYRLVIIGGQSCGDCVRKTSYPIKEGILGAVDGISGAVNPSADARAASGGFVAAPTFRHDGV